MHSRMYRLWPRIVSFLALGLLATGTAGSATGQAAPTRALATREQLEALLSAGQGGRGALSARERGVIQARLNTGDFQTGDRLVLRVVGDTSLTDTFTVRAGPEVILPNMDPLSLRGVLRSELLERVRQHLAKYIRAPQVEATSLIRIGVLGGVARPGYYNVAPDMPLGEIVQAVGGVSPDGDLRKATIQRNSQERWTKEDVRQAMARGLSLDELGLQGGDEMTIGRRGAGIGPTLAIVTGVVGLAATIVLITRN